MRSFAIVIRRAYFEAKKRRKYAKNVVVNMSSPLFLLNSDLNGINGILIWKLVFIHLLPVFV